MSKVLAILRFQRRFLESKTCVTATRIHRLLIYLVKNYNQIRPYYLFFFESLIEASSRFVLTWNMWQV